MPLSSRGVKGDTGKDLMHETRPCGGVRLRGWLFIPATSHDACLAITMTHGFAGVKEHRLEAYATAFADSGFVHAKIRFDFDEVNCDSLLTECNCRSETAYATTNNKRIGDRGHQWCPSLGSMPVMYRKSQAGGFARKGGRLWTKCE